MARQISVNIVGSGNVATHLIRAFLRQPEIVIKQLFARNLSELKEFEGTAVLINDSSLLQPADVTILAVSDTAVAGFSKQLKNYQTLTVHTSGSLPLDSIQTNRKGVFYPFQTFSKQKKAVDFSTVPILIEAPREQDLIVLEELAKILSNTVVKSTFKQRKALHIAGVFAANFVNHLYVEAASILEENQLSFDLLKPLITEVADKVQNLSPEVAQTGPAVRNDREMIEKHIQFLQHQKQKEIYQLLSEAIITYHKKQKI